MRALVVILVAAILYSVQTANAAEWHNSFGIGFINVNDDLEDIHKSNIQAEGLDDSEFEAALGWGYFYQPYYLYENGFALGMGIATPTGIVAEEHFFNIPLHVDARYFLGLDSSVSGYVRAGIRYNLAFGEYVEGTDPGAILGIGLLFEWNASTKVGVEFTDDASEIEIRDIANNRNESINLNQSIISVVATF